MSHFLTQSARALERSLVTFRLCRHAAKRSKTRPVLGQGTPSIAPAHARQAPLLAPPRCTSTHTQLPRSKVDEQKNASRTVATEKVAHITVVQYHSSGKVHNQTRTTRRQTNGFTVEPRQPQQASHHKNGPCVRPVARSLGRSRCTTTYTTSAPRPTTTMVATRHPSPRRLLAHTTHPRSVLQ